MNEKLKIIFISIGAFFLGVLGYILGRYTNRRGVPSNHDSIGRVGTSFDDERAIINNLTKNYGLYRSTIAEVAINNGTARDGIRTAKEILLAAKRRQQDNSN